MIAEKMVTAEQLVHFLHRDAYVVACNKDGLVAIEKPCGVMSHPNSGAVNENAVVNCRYDFNKQAYVIDGKCVYLLNRLDSPVSGIILCGLNEDIANSVKMAFKHGDVDREYIALTKGFPRHKSGVWRSRMRKVVDNGRIAVSSGDGNIAETKYEVLESFRAFGVTLSLVKLWLVTGRTHQLRIHCAENGLPIVGDRRYGCAEYNRRFEKTFSSSRLFLHSAHVEVQYFLKNVSCSFCADSKECPLSIVSDYVDIKRLFRTSFPKQE